MELNAFSMLEEQKVRDEQLNQRLENIRVAKERAALTKPKQEKKAPLKV